MWTGRCFLHLVHCIEGIRKRTCTAASQPWEEPQKTSSQKMRHNFSKEQCRKVNPTLLKINKWEEKCSDGGEWLKQAQSTCGMFILEDIKNTAALGPQQPALKWKLPLLCAGIGRDDLMRLLHPELLFDSRIL